MRLLLDTHTLIWHFEGSSSLSQAARNAIDAPDNQLFISAASLWELAIKVGLGKLRIEISLPELAAGYEKTGTTLLSITPEHAMAVQTLPSHHRDPFDRILISQAKLESMTLITHDEMIQQYDVPQIW